MRLVQKNGPQISVRIRKANVQRKRKKGRRTKGKKGKKGTTQPRCIGIAACLQCPIGYYVTCKYRYIGILKVHK